MTRSDPTEAQARSKARTELNAASDAFRDWIQANATSGEDDAVGRVLFEPLFVYLLKFQAEGKELNQMQLAALALHEKLGPRRPGDQLIAETFELLAPPDLIARLKAAKRAAQA